MSYGVSHGKKTQKQLKNKNKTKTKITKIIKNKYVKEK